MNVLQDQPLNENGGNAKIVYFLFLASSIFGVTAIIGVVMAYMYKDEAASWLQTHYRFQIRTFWIGLFFSIVSGALTFVGIGFIMFLILVLWLIVRCVKGQKL